MQLEVGCNNAVVSVNKSSSRGDTASEQKILTRSTTQEGISEKWFQYTMVAESIHCDLDQILLTICKKTL